MEMQPGLEHDADAAGPEAIDAAGREVLRVSFSDPETWHDLAERGTPRNG
ncbi:MAG: hypothetical protein JO306_04050 [Gemmatimonadetes bacterium]|nr:hypothetical protein [Gemmatimonadota bacterium]